MSLSLICEDSIMPIRNRVFGICSLSLFLLAPGIGRAMEDKKHHPETESKDVGKESERALAAANALLDINKVPEKGIPQDLLNRAEAVAVVPNVVKAAFAVGGRHGKGIVTRRLADGSWGTPAFIELSGGSFG